MGFPVLVLQIITKEGNDQEIPFEGGKCGLFCMQIFVCSTGIRKDNCMHFNLIYDKELYKLMGIQAETHIFLI